MESDHKSAPQQPDLLMYAMSREREHFMLKWSIVASLVCTIQFVKKTLIQKQPAAVEQKQVRAPQQFRRHYVYVL